MDPASLLDLSGSEILTVAPRLRPWRMLLDHHVRKKKNKKRVQSHETDVGEGELSGSHAWVGAHSARREQLRCFGFKRMRHFSRDACCELLLLQTPGSFARSCTHTSTITHTNNPLPLSKSEEAPWFEHWWSFFLQTPAPAVERLPVLLTPVRSLLSPRWRTSASPSAARSSCTAAGPVC